MKTCVVIPVYEHAAALGAVLAQIKPLALPTILVDDGSSLVCAQVLMCYAQAEGEWLTLLTRTRNEGKGAAVMDGFRHALQTGFTHAIQIDADGQHQVNDIPKFLAAATNNPSALILGQPIFDQGAPKSRRYGRVITNVWISINTLSGAITDGMCGFRLYPLAAVQALLATTNVAKRMAFDIDIVVRLYWQGLTIINIPTVVRYPPNGVSHFKLWQDNVQISAVHAKLFFGMLMRCISLLARHWR